MGMSNPVSESIPPDDSSQGMKTQADLFKQYVDANNLYINQIEDMFWFEFGGNRIGWIDVKPKIEGEDAPVWKLVGKYKQEFPGHFSLVIAEPKHGFFILGGQKTNGGSNCR